MREGKLDTYTQRQWFLQGLPTPIQHEMCYRVELQQKQDVLLSFDDMLKNVLFMVKAKQRLIDMVRPSGSKEQMAELVEKSFYKSSDKYISPAEKSMSKKVSFVSEPIYNSEITAPKQVQPTSQQPDITKLTQGMERLALAVEVSTKQANQNQDPNQNRSQNLPKTPLPNQPEAFNKFNQTHRSEFAPRGFGRGGGRGGYSRGNYAPIGFGRGGYSKPNLNVASDEKENGSGNGNTGNTGEYCAYCGNTDHYFKRHCQAFEEDLSRNRVHLQEGMLYLRKYSPGACEVFLRRGQT